MDNYVDERDYKLLEGDKYTFFVLRRIIDGPCKLLLSDHERLIICFSTEPFPAWIWTACTCQRIAICYCPLWLWGYAGNAEPQPKNSADYVSCDF